MYVLLNTATSGLWEIHKVMYMYMYMYFLSLCAPAASHSVAESHVASHPIPYSHPVPPAQTSG